MSQTCTAARRVTRMSGAVFLSAALALPAHSQLAPAVPPAAGAEAPGAAQGPSAARQAIDVRKAVYTLIQSNFRPLGEVLKGNVQYDAADAQKRITRIAFLTGLLNDSFPDISNVGEPDTKAKPDVWANHSEFVQKLDDFQLHVTKLEQVNSTEKGATDAFKAALNAVAQDCKGCHDTYRAK